MLKDVIIHKIVFDEEDNKGIPAGFLMKRWRNCSK